MTISGTVYRHTQIAKVILATLGLIFVAEVLITVASRFHPALLVVLAVIGLVALLFGSLTVSVTTEDVALRFGPGPIGKRFRVADIRGTRVVRNRWFYGWGIRWTPYGWLYNVSGLSAVEITLESGRRYRIGTDEPERLAQAIESVLRR